MEIIYLWSLAYIELHSIDNMKIGKSLLLFILVLYWNSLYWKYSICIWTGKNKNKIIFHSNWSESLKIKCLLVLDQIPFFEYIDEKKNWTELSICQMRCFYSEIQLKLSIFKSCTNWIEHGWSVWILYLNRINWNKEHPFIEIICRIIEKKKTLRDESTNAQNI